MEKSYGQKYNTYSYFKTCIDKQTLTLLMGSKAKTLLADKRVVSKTKKMYRLYRKKTINSHFSLYKQ